ncbi:glycosyltransferase family 4 protein [Paenibacillus dokdonensis]|uniref:glycosyltransferase family 4 protein n=1 Tax=Paenibacillus dokdonensis TaxID=2567944 RepID=UPI0010A82FD1|nr:glycosyltransferase family 4 protein [Paenibacillus dokdonensis]
MRETLIVISDYVEGEPVVASVRFAGLMEHFREQYDLIVIHDGKYGTGASRYAVEDYPYVTMDSVLTQSMKGDTDANERGVFGQLAENLLRNPWTLSAWRNYKYSKFKFDRMNAALYAQLDLILTNRTIGAVFVTVPDVYALYILDYIKRKSPHMQAVIEIRDIINHSIGKGNPKYVFRQAEQMISRLADGVIAVSEGIYQHYRIRNPQKEMELITNGYDENLFKDSDFMRLSGTSESISLVHIGSIYKGRNVGALMDGLDLFYRQTGIAVTLHIAGLLDRQAVEDIDRTEYSEPGVRIHIYGSMEHHKAVQLLKAANVAVILTHTRGSGFAIPGKTFEYIGACKPILAVSEDQELISLVQDRYGECAGHDPKAIAASLGQLIKNSYDFSGRHKYSRKLQAERILGFLGHITLDGGINMIGKEV